MRRLSAIAAIATILLTAPAAMADPARAVFEPVACWNGSGPETGTTCGYVDVPENWQAHGEDGRRLRLPVARFAAENKIDGAPAIIFLTGGPGGTTWIDQPNRRAGWRRYATAAFPRHDLIVFEQRGGSLSRPALRCPALADPGNWAPLSENAEAFDDPLARRRDVLTACAERLLAAGHDLSAYNSRQSASDIIAIADALGYAQVIPVGVSYGTHLAQTLLEMYPARVAAAVLDSVLDGPARRADHLVQSLPAFERLLAACQGHARCAAAYPRLADDFVQVLSRLEQEPVVLEVWNARDLAKPLFARVDRDLLLDVLYEALYRNQQITQLPWVIDGLARGQADRLVPFLENYLYQPYLREMAHGMGASIWCQEMYQRAALPEPPDLAPLASHIHAWSEANRATHLCNDWPVAPRDDGTRSDNTENRPNAPIPVLLLSSAFDPTTPVEYAEAVASRLPRSHHFIFPASGHGQMGGDRCAFQVMVDFIADPSERPSPDCLNDLRQPAFLALGGR